MKTLKIFKSLFIVCLTCCLQSCLYETDKMSEFEIERPADSHPADITLSVNQDSILIFQETEFKYSVNTYGLNFNIAVVKYRDREDVYYSGDENFTVTPDMNSNEWFDLTIEFYISTGTGSLADKLKAENYVGSRTWKIKYIDMTTFDYHFQHRINSDGVLELFYIKPHGLDTSIGRMIFSGYDMDITKVSGDTVFYADSTYWGGYRYYNLMIKKNSAQYIYFDYSINYSIPSLTVTNIDLDSCIVSWAPISVKNHYVLKANGNNIYEGNLSTFKDRQPDIGTIRQYTLCIYPLKRENSLPVTNLYYNNNIGTNALYGACYSLKYDKFFVSRPRFYPAIEILDTLPIDDSYGYNSTFYNMMSNSTGDLILGIKSGTVRIFDENLNEKGNFYIAGSADNITISNNDCIGYHSNANYTIKNLGTDTSWKEFSFKPHYDDSTQVVYIRGLNLTADGNYVCCRAAYDFYLYDVSDHKNAKIVFTAPHNDFRRVVGNPLNKDELIAMRENSVEIRSCPDFQLIRKFEASGLGAFVYCDVDSYNNLLLVCTNNYFHIIDLSSMKEALRLNASYYDSYKAKFMKKQIFVNNIVVDLSKYLK